MSANVMIIWQVAFTLIFFILPHLTWHPSIMGLISTWFINNIGRLLTFHWGFINSLTAYFGSLHKQILRKSSILSFFRISLNLEDHIKGEVCRLYRELCQSLICLLLTSFFLTLHKIALTNKLCFQDYNQGDHPQCSSTVVGASK